jgi:hypothetical protein
LAPSRANKTAAARPLPQPGPTRRKALRKAEGFTLHGGYCERARQSVVPQNSSHYVTTVQVYHA